MFEGSINSPDQSLAVLQAMIKAFTSVFRLLNGTNLERTM